jgi:NAD(P)-dependent dehydrogenase (short-subunit alcohol dehydrogenase family)
MTTIVITGTARGIGLELAKQALAKGWTVFGSTRNTQPKSLTENVKFHSFRFDVTDPAAIRAAAAQIDQPIDILINNAGVIGPDRQSSLDMDFNGFALTLDINTLGPLRVTQAFLPHLKRSANPRIITVSSLMGSMAGSSFDRIAYRASKAAVNKIMQGLANDLMPEGVCAVSMHPGWVQTDMGGRAADIPVAVSATGILEVAEGLTMEFSGRFINHVGSKLAW